MADPGAGLIAIEMDIEMVAEDAYKKLIKKSTEQSIMTDQMGGQAIDPWAYQVGGSLAWDHPSYVSRASDDALYQAVQQGQLCAVLGPQQVGKSSLRIRVRRRLEQAGYCCATLFGRQLIDSPKDYLRWDKQLTSAIWDSLYPSKMNTLRWWLKETETLLPQQRL
ncbi:MAG: hypothetical protein AAFP20_21610, partial [Cyanobacteria bacterium J06614_10]